MELKMRKILLITLLLIVGCSKEPINYEETLNERDGVFYTKDTNKPYSGQVFSLYDDGKKKGEGTIKDGKMISKTEWEYNRNGQKSSERTYKDGEFHGLRTIWFENGQMKYKGTWKNGKQDGLSTRWYENGQKDMELTFKDGRQDGLWTSWYENGQKRDEVTFKDGEEISYKEWNYDGSVKE